MSSRTSSTDNNSGFCLHILLFCYIVKRFVSVHRRRYISISTQSLLTCRLTVQRVAYSKQHAYAETGHYDRCSALAYERQRLAGNREEPHSHRHVYECLQSQQHTQSHGQICGIFLLAAFHYTPYTEQQYHVYEHHQQSARHTKLLDDDGVRGSVLANWEGMDVCEGIHVDAVPAYNITEGHLQFHPQGRDNGYILNVDGFRIYIAGDTEDIPEMSAIKDIDVAFLPCNQPYTMTVPQCIAVAKVVKPKVLIPYHFGQTDISGIPEALPGIDVRLREMR